MTSYNRQSFIAEAIESVQQSSFQDWELIIVDDGSIDETVNIAKRYAAADHRISVQINEQNLGDYPNRNKAASYAKGELMMYVDSDDRILKDGFQQCINAMKAFPQAGLGMQYNDASDRPPFYMNSEEVIRHHFFKKPCLMIGPGGTILRRSFFEQIGGYPERYGPANDMYFNLKAVAAGPILMLPFTFNFYRIHEGQEINNKYSYLYNNFNYLRDALAELDLPLTEKEKEWLLNKNRRRFLVNLVRYLRKTGDAGKTIAARKYAGFGLKDFIKALVH
jgi:glycosyltransferase involved in cell wall biosynthesis